MFRSFLIIKISFIFITGLSWIACESKEDSVFDTAKRKITADNFMGSESCKECHEKEYDLWMDSHHQLAMQLADSTTVLGDFDNANFTSRGVNYSFRKHLDSFIINTIGPEGNYKDFIIKYTFGVYPLQQYIVEFEKGRFQCLLAAWDSQSGKWFDLQPQLDIHHEEWMHWTGGSMTWNKMCADCHSTLVEKNFDNSTDSYNSTFVEINVGCESCHGPGDLHNSYYEKEKYYKAKGVDAPKFYMPKDMGSKELVQKCGRCHSRRAMLTNVFDYEGHFLDHYNPNLLRYPTFEKDGQILDEDYVYASFMQSKMYHYGISCRDCHDMHSLELRREGNALCLGCHLPKYDQFDHHFHEAGSEAAQCINCHMSGRYYMVNDFRRDHSFRNPRPDQTLLYGTTNACNSCHKDKSAQWASDFIKGKYGQIRPDHFSNSLLPALDGNLDSMQRLIATISYPEIARATAMNAYSEQIRSQNDVDFIKGFLKDTSALVRQETILALSNTGLDMTKEFQYLLDDPIRLVRIAAARYYVLNNIPLKNAHFEKAKTEFIKSLEVNADFASGQHQLALYYQSRGEIEASIHAYEKAIIIDNHYNMSRMNLALLVYQQGNVTYAEKLYNKVIEQEADYSYPYFMLGLLYNEEDDTKLALHYLSEASKREPFISRAYYNYALKLHETKKYELADQVLTKALEKAPEDESLLYVKVLGLIQLKDFQKAKQTIIKLIEIAPGNDSYNQLARDIENSLVN